MGITTDETGNISVSGKEAVSAYIWVATRHALRLEIRTGMKMSRHGSALKAAKMHGFVPESTRTKKAALDYMNEVGALAGLERVEA